MTHLLKTWPGEWESVASGRKTHEVRNCVDRKFVEGDDLILAEWNPAIYHAALGDHGMADEDVVKKAAEQKAFTGRRLLRKVGYVSVAGSWGLPDNLCVFTIHNYGITTR